ncbi:MAG TPA: hypothetical protein VHJ00_06350, partial [Bradyrhizobium sp.]|nr:hypothetical protein [Bradyrhizobium sp.]
MAGGGAGLLPITVRVDGQLAGAPAVIGATDGFGASLAGAPASLCASGRFFGSLASRLASIDEAGGFSTSPRPPGGIISRMLSTIGKLLRGG